MTLNFSNKLIGVVFFAIAFIPMQSEALTLADVRQGLQQLLAQLETLNSQSAAVTSALLNSSGGCAELTFDLLLGSTDKTSSGEVSKLQRFLALDRTIYPEGRVTGIFDVPTEQAVQRWQQKNAVVFSGTPSTTGYGAVRFKTRAAMLLACNKHTLPTPEFFKCPLDFHLDVSGECVRDSMNGGTPYAQIDAPKDGILRYKNGSIALSGKVSNTDRIGIIIVKNGITAHDTGRLVISGGRWQATINKPLPAGEYRMWIYVDPITAAKFHISGGLIASQELIVSGSSTGKSERSPDLIRTADIKRIQEALEQYYEKHDKYPAVLSRLKKVPKDPSTKKHYLYAAYGSASLCTGYHLGALLVVEQQYLEADADAYSEFTCKGSARDFSGSDPVYDVTNGM